MPISGGKYVAPTWANGQAPAINAAELQAICDTVAANQTRLCGEIVSYTGTGTQKTSSNPCKVTFSHAVQAIIWIGAEIFENGLTRLSISMADESTTFQGGHGFCCGLLYSSFQPIDLRLYGKRNAANTQYSWYANDDGYGEMALNKSGETYYFLGIWGAD